MRHETRLAPPFSSRRGGGAAFSLLLLAASACADNTAKPGMAAVASAAAGMLAASGSSGTAPAAAGQSGGVAASGKLSFATDVYEKVIRVRCAACHNDGPSFGGLALFPGGAMTAYQNLVGVPAGAEATYQCRASGLMRVTPGDPEHSLMYLKLTNPPCGSKMPPAAFAQVTEAQVELVRQWIADGAAP